MTVSVVIYLGYRGIKFIYLSLYLVAFVEAFFHNGAASNQRLPAPKAEKELNDRKIKKLNGLIAKMW